MSKKAKINTNLNFEVPQPKKETNANSYVASTPLLFGAKNYKMMLFGLVVIFLGFGLMMGTNNNVEGLDAVYPANEVYSARRIILAPAVVIIGFLIELYAILLVKKSN